MRTGTIPTLDSGLGAPVADAPTRDVDALGCFACRRRSPPSELVGDPNEKAPPRTKLRRQNAGSKLTANEINFIQQIDQLDAYGPRSVQCLLEAVGKTPG